MAWHSSEIASLSYRHNNSPNGFKAALESLGWDVFSSHTVDFMWKAKTDLQPVINVKSHDSGCAEAKNNKQCIT